MGNPLIVAYDYNSMTPRFFSSYFTKIQPGFYDIQARKAVGASAAAPTYFDPLQNENNFGMDEMLIDGGVVANNPSLYAEMMARYLFDQDEVIMISIGTGDKPFKKIKSASERGKTSLFKTDNNIMGMDVRAAQVICETYFGKDYLRINPPTTRLMDKVDKANIQGLKDDGNGIVKKMEPQIRAFLARVILAKFGK